MALLAVTMFFSAGLTELVPAGTGLAFPSPSQWLRGGWADFLASIACSGLTMGGMLLLNRIHNILRSMTSLYVALFSVMMLGTPNLASQFYAGSLLAALIPLCLLLLLSCYRYYGATHRVFLIFFLLSLAGTTQYCFIPYIAVMFLGLAQMAIFNRRTVLAAIFGIITPWWILIGFGLINPLELQLPVLEPVFSKIGTGDTVLLFLSLGVTVAAQLTAYSFNVFKAIAYNARARGINGVFSILSIVTVAMICLDFHNILSYVPLLYFCAAVEISRYFATHRNDRSCILVLSLIAVYIALFVCQTLI